MQEIMWEREILIYGEKKTEIEIKLIVVLYMKKNSWFLLDFFLHF